MQDRKRLTPLRRMLLINLERIIGAECYNANIQNWGPGGVFQGSGRHFNYPLTFRNDKGEKVRSSWVDEKISDKMLPDGYYAFGANELHIMAGLENVLEHLESFYSIDFEKPRFREKGGN